jgi:branched-chain amino acid aminotransferase
MAGGLWADRGDDQVARGGVMAEASRVQEGGQVAGERTNWVHVNGSLVPSDEASVSVFDHGLLYGDGVYDTLFAKYGFIFKLQQHVERLRRSMRAIALDVGLDDAAISDAIVQTVRHNGLDDAYIKVVATRGTSAEPLLDPRGCVPTFIVFARPYLSLSSSDQQEKGLRAKIVSIRRIGMEALDPRIKSLNYLNLILGKIEALNAGCDEALFLDEAGLVCEAPGYNVFVVTRGSVATPDASILEGITRETVLELCAELDIPTEVRGAAPYHLYTADEVFLTSTAGGLVPVAMVDGRTVGDGSPGPVFRRLFAAYDELLRSGRQGTPLANAAS